MEWNGTFDSMTVSLISTATIATAGELVNDTGIEPRRFGADIILDTAASQPCIERKWIKASCASATVLTRVRSASRQDDHALPDHQPRPGHRPATARAVPGLPRR